METGLPREYLFCAAVVLLVTLSRAFLPCQSMKVKRLRKELIKDVLHKNFKAL